MRPVRHRVFRWLLIFGAWTLLGLFICSQNFVAYSRVKQSVPWSELLAMSLGICFLWALATPLILWLIQRFKIERENWLRHGLVHLLASLVLAVSIKVFHEYLMVKFIYPPSSAKSFSVAAAAQSFFTIFDYWIQIYWLIVLVVHATEFYQRSRANEWKAAQLESRLAQAQLQALKTQLNPHFLFNTLNAVSALMHRDVRAANRMMTQLSDLLRLSLETSGAQEVPLKVELDFLDRYVEIQRARFPDRLHMGFTIQPEALDALVPSFLLQPLVENAIRHGIAQSSAYGSVEVTARVANGLVELVVRDNGAGFPAQRTLVPREGVGLSNTRARLRHLYGAAHRFELRNVPAGGAEVFIVIPFRPAEPSGEGDLPVAEAEYIAADAGAQESPESVAQITAASGEGSL
jgi:two-component system, LytTR family, sensor kinase